MAVGGGEMRDELNEGIQVGQPLHRDNARFRFLFPNGKPVLPEGLKGNLSTLTSYEIVRNRKRVSVEEQK
jgi:hypothetical protein